MIRVFLADDESPARERLKELLGKAATQDTFIFADEIVEGGSISQQQLFELFEGRLVRLNGKLLRQKIVVFPFSRCLWLHTGCPAHAAGVFSPGPRIAPPWTAGPPCRHLFGAQVNSEG